jgi:hypothetical protein
MNKKKWCGNSKILFTITMVFVVCCFMSTSLWAQYCIPSPDNNYFHIIGVEVADLDNSSGKDEGGYGDYTHLTAHLTQGKTYSVSLETNGFGGFFLYWKIWIDYNDDKDFGDAGEDVFEAYGFTTVTGTFTVPGCTITGDTRMRVYVGTHYTLPCENGYGEVEDYTVHITSNVGYDDVFPSTSTSTYRRAMPFTMPEDGTIESVAMYHEAGTGSENMLLAVYDGEGHPQNRIGVTSSTSVDASVGWQTIDLTSPVVVQGGTHIWLAWVYESNPGISYQTGSPGRAQSSDTWSGGMPDPFGCSSNANYIYSIYAKYTKGGEPTYRYVGDTMIYEPIDYGAYREAMPFTMPENGTIKSVTMYHNGGSGEMTLAVYDGVSAPGSQLAITPSTPVCSTPGWQTINLTSSVFVTGGSTIWLAWVYQNNPGVRKRGGLPGDKSYRSDIPGYDMPDPFGSATETTVIFSIYATYTAN